MTKFTGTPSNVKIVSAGTAATTLVLVDGIEIENVGSIQIDKISPDCPLVRAYIEVVFVELEITGQAQNN